jgi:hypothetical protein
LVRSITKRALAHALHCHYSKLGSSERWNDVIAKANGINVRDALCADYQLVIPNDGALRQRNP